MRFIINLYSKINQSTIALLTRYFIFVGLIVGIGAIIICAESKMYDKLIFFVLLESFIYANSRN